MISSITFIGISDLTRIIGRIVKRETVYLRRPQSVGIIRRDMPPSLKMEIDIRHGVTERIDGPHDEIRIPIHIDRKRIDVIRHYRRVNINGIERGKRRRRISRSAIIAVLRYGNTVPFAGGGAWQHQVSIIPGKSGKIDSGGDILDMYGRLRNTDAVPVEHVYGKDTRSGKLFHPVLSEGSEHRYGPKRVRRILAP